MSIPDQDLMATYLDGRLNIEDTAAFEARLSAEPALARRLAALLLMDLELRSALVPTRQKSSSTWHKNRISHAALLAAALLMSLIFCYKPWRNVLAEEITIEVPTDQAHDVSVDGGPLQSRLVRAGQSVSTRVPITFQWHNEATAVVLNPIAGQAVVQILDRGMALDVGMLDAEVAPRDRNHAFHIVAGDTVATVVGTHFRITRNADETALTVRTGRVEFRHKGRVQMVESGGSASTAGLASDPGPGLVPSAPAEDDPQKGLIARWSGESLVGNQLVDLAGGGPQGEASGLRAISSHHGLALHFSGDETVAAIPHNPAFDPGKPAQPFTIATWLRLEKNDHRDQTIIGKGRNLSTPGPTLAVVLEVSGGNHVDLYRWHDAEPHQDRKMEVSGWTVPHLADGAWHHVVVVAEHASMRRCYFDGVAVGTDSRTWLHDTTNLSRWTIGRLENMGFTAEVTFTGDLQDLRLYNRAITASEVTTLFSTSP